MSALLAAGCALSRFHGVSVVPMIQCRPQGMTKSTELLGLGDEAGLGPDPVARHHEVDALAGLHVEGAPAADQVLDVVGPDTGGVDDDPGPDRELPVGLEVAHPGTDDPLPLPQEAHHLGPGRHLGTVEGGGAGQRHHQPRVVDLAVVVADRPVQTLDLEVRRDPRDLLAEQVLVLGHPGVAEPARPGSDDRHGVVQDQSGADVGPLVGVVQRVEERHRPDQVRRQPGQQQAALLEGFLDQREVEHLQVAQAPVHELAAAAARAAGQVALLDQAGAQPAGHGVQGHAGTGDAAADHQHVELLVGRGRGQHSQGLVAGGGAERAGLRHAAILPPHPGGPTPPGPAG